MRRRLLTMMGGGALPEWIGYKLYDTFTGADTTLMTAHTAETGQTYSLPSTYEGLYIISNECRRVAYTASNNAYTRASTALAADVTGSFSATKDSSGASGQAGVILRDKTSATAADSGAVNLLVSLSAVPFKQALIYTGAKGTLRASSAQDGSYIVGQTVSATFSLVGANASITIDGSLTASWTSAGNLTETMGGPHFNASHQALSMDTLTVSAA